MVTNVCKSILDTTTVAELKKLRICYKDFEIIKVIGRGHFGEVQVVCEKHTQDVYAMKVLRKTDTLARQNVSYVVDTSIFF